MTLDKTLVSLIALLLINSPSFAYNVYAPLSCEDGPSHCDASGLGYDSSGCQNSCIDGNTCVNGLILDLNSKGVCTLSIDPSKGYMCSYAYQDPSPPNCGECGVLTCSGVAGWWCQPDDTKCSGGKICDATNTCVCPDGKVWDGSICKAVVIATGCDQDGDTIIDTQPNTCCSAYPGTKCKLDTGVYQCVNDPSCPLCADSDATTAFPDGKNKNVKGTCRDNSGGTCDGFQSGGSKCADTCASNGAVNEFYCAGIANGSTGGNEPPPGPGPCTTCGDPAVCVGQCVPGESQSKQE